MINLLRKLIPSNSPETKSCLEELEKIEKEFSFRQFEVVKPQVRGLLKDEKRVEHSIAKDKLSPRTLIFLLITNVLGREIPSGQYHVYRGALNGGGQELLKMWDIAVDELEKSGYHSAEESAKEKKWIRDQIQQMG